MATSTGGNSGLVVSRIATNFDSGSTPSSFYTSIGQGFIAGAIPSGSHPEVRLSDGVTVVSDQQCQNTVTWGDGSLKFAQLTWKHPNLITASGSDTVKIYSASGACPTTSTISTSTLLAQDYRLEIVISGTTYTLGLNNELNAGTRVRQIRAGPTMAAWKVWGAFRNGTSIGSTDQGDFWGIFYAYVYSDGTIRIMPLVFTERVTNSTANAPTLTTFAFKNYQGGPTTLCTYSSVNVAAGSAMICPADGDGNPYYSGTDTPKVVWAFPLLTLSDSTTTGFYDAKLIWWYHSTPTSRANSGLSATGYSYTPMDNSYIVAVGGATGWDSTGGSPWIGPLAKDDVSFFLNGTYAGLIASRTNAWLGLNNGYWYWDLSKGFPANLTSNTYTGLPTGSTTVGWGINPTISGTSTGPTGSVQDATHAPDFGYMQYLYSGDEWWLEIAMGAPIGNIGAANPSLRNLNSTEGNYVSTGNAGRGQAWYTRNIGNVAWVTPTGHLMKQYLNDMLTNQLTALNNKDTASASPVGMVNFEDVSGHPIWSAWMHDHLTTSIAMEVRRGTESGSAVFVTSHITLNVLGRANNGCAYNSTWYRYGLAAGSGGAGPADVVVWSDEWVGVNDSVNSQAITTSCNGSGVKNGYGNDNTSGDDYALLLQYSGSTAAIAGISGGSTLTTYMDATEAACSTCTETWWGSQQWKRIRVPQ